jgi:glycolate oxidase FAD binding subunit
MCFAKNSNKAHSKNSRALLRRTATIARMPEYLQALDDIVQRIAHARSVPALSRKPLRVRGGGSKDFFGAQLHGDLLETRGLQGIVSYEPTELVVTVRSGTLLSTLEALLQEQNQCLPFEPPHFGHAGATVGGLVASGLSGPSRASVGATRDFVLGARFINGLGEHLTFGGQVMKNVAGYDLSRVLAGSWGTLGVVTEVSLKVLAFAPSEASMVCQLPQDMALQLLHRWGGQPLPLNASCWHCEPGASSGRLTVRLRGAQAAVQAALPKMQADVEAQGGQAQPADAEAAMFYWDALRNQQQVFFTQAPNPNECLWRLSVAQTSPVLDIPYAQCVEWQGAQRWVWAPAAAANQLHALAAQAGGHASLFRRPAGALADSDAGAAVFAPLDATQQRIQTALQAEFDPDGVFNTGRLDAPA